VIGRRAFVSLLGGMAAAWPLTASAQQRERIRRIGVLMGIANDAEGQSRVAAFRQALQALGWDEGSKVEFSYRWQADSSEQARRFADEMLEWRPDVILSNSTPMTLAISKATRTVPIVFANVGDPIGSGFVENFARPSGNLTGFANFQPSLAGKWLELLKDIDPRITRVVYLYNPATIAPRLVPTIQAAAPLVSIELTAAPVSDISGIESSIMQFKGTNDGVALLIFPDIFLTSNRKLIVGLAAQQRLPALYPFKFFTRDGGLISYGIEGFEAFRQAASYVDRILRGVKPTELPVQAPNKFELVINLKTAKALGLTVPDKLLAIADEVIE
jgi:putative tryptophan/tyrosine transport system substrate-binding protein